MPHFDFEHSRFMPRPFFKDGVSLTWSYWMHPWAFLRDIWWSARSFLHRGRYGWDAGDVWSMDYYLAEVMPQMLRHLKEHHYGVPLFCFDHASVRESNYENPEGADARWCAWLEEKAAAFDTYTDLMSEHAANNDPRWKMVQRQMRDLFTHFTSLGD